MRNTAAAISTLFGVLFVIPIIVRFLPSSWADPITKYLPNTVGEAITHVHPDPTALSPWAGFGLFCAYAAVVLSPRPLSCGAATPEPAVAEGSLPQFRDEEEAFWRDGTGRP